MILSSRRYGFNCACLFFYFNVSMLLSMLCILSIHASREDSRSRPRSDASPSKYDRVVVRALDQVVVIVH